VVKRYGALTTQREPPNLYFQFTTAETVLQPAPNGQFHAVSNPVGNKSVVNAALQNGKVISRIKMALTY
jgi:hypothetical protein